MKKILITLIVALALSSASAHAQMGTVGNNTLAGAALGGVAGAVIGNNSRGHDSAKGALIGVAAGGLIGAVVGQQKVINRTQTEQAPAWEARPANPDYWHGRERERTVVVVQQDPFAELDARIANARAEADSARRNAESLRRAYEQASQAAYAAEQRAEDLARARRSYSGGGYR